MAVYNTLIDTAGALGSEHAVTHLRNAAAHAFSFATNPTAGRPLFGDKGRPQLGTGVLERPMRDMNRRTELGVRWSIPGARGMLMIKLARKYHHRRWSPKPVPADTPSVRFTVVTLNGMSGLGYNTETLESCHHPPWSAGIILGSRC